MLLRTFQVFILLVSFFLLATSPVLPAFTQSLGLDKTQLSPVGPETVNSGTIASTIGTIANIVIGIIAAISVFYIINGAFKWMNDGEKEARPMVINAVIGLIIAILSFFIVQFAVGAGGFLNNQLNKNATTGGSDVQIKCQSRPNTVWANLGNGNGSCTCRTDYIETGAGILESGCRKNV